MGVVVVQRMRKILLPCRSRAEKGLRMRQIESTNRANERKVCISIV